jgi:hypothetical protein
MPIRTLRCRASFIDAWELIVLAKHMMRWLAVWSCTAALSGCAKQRVPVLETDASVGLPDDTAGNGCKRDTDCATGRCASTLHIQTATTSVMAPGGYCTTDCEIDSQCGSGGECSVPAGEASGECLGRCKADGECRAGYRCVGAGRTGGILVSGTCQPQPETGRLADGAAGRTCTSDADCKGGQCDATSTLGTRLPGNYCTARCLEDSQCGAGGACLLFSGSSDAGHCFARCASNLDCARDGYSCRLVGPGFRACYPAPDPLPDNTAGKACSADADCGGGDHTCASELPFGSFASYEIVPAPNGYCTQECALDSDCGAGAQCISRGVQGGMCLAKCSAMMECRDGYSCLAHGRDLNEQDRVCIPAP